MMRSVLLTVLFVLSTATCQETVYEYFGCAVDTGKRIFQGFHIVIPKMTQRLCIEACRERDLLYAGVQFGNHCFCDDTKPSTFVSELECNKKCKGDAGQMCGGTWRMGIFSTGLTDADTVYKYLGCVKDSSTRILGGYHKIFPNKLSHRFCALECKGKGFRFAGVQNGNACFCGNTRPHVGYFVNEAECKKKCTGNYLQKCGAVWRMGVLETDTKPEEENLLSRISMHCPPNCHPPQQPQCGQSNLHSVEVLAVIVDGKASKSGDFPWHVAIFHLQKGSWSNVCGGSLVSPRSVLTAAHCVTERCDGCQSPVMSPTDVMAALGKTNSSWDTGEASAIKRAVKEIYVPVNYWGSTTNYVQDVAVLVLKEPVPVSDVIMPVCLDRGHTHAHELTAGRSGYVVGWGKTEDCPRGGVCPSSETLQYSRTSVIDFNTCLRLMQRQSRTLNARLTPDKICSGNGSVSVIQAGDSGGGLVYNFDNTFYIYGIVSTRFKRDESFSFGTYTFLSRYLDWVLKNIV